MSAQKGDAEHASCEFDDCVAKPRLEHVESWEVQQNGFLTRLDRKMDRLLFWFIGLMGVMLVALVTEFLTR